MHKLKFGVATVTILATIFASGCTTFSTTVAGDLGKLNKIKHIHKDDIVRHMGSPVYVDERVNGTAYVWSDGTFNRIYEQIYHGSTVSGNVMTHHWENRAVDLEQCTTIVFNKDGYPKGMRQGEDCVRAAQNGGYAKSLIAPLLGIVALGALAASGSN